MTKSNSSSLKNRLRPRNILIISTSRLTMSTTHRRSTKTSFRLHICLARLLTLTTRIPNQSNMRSRTSSTRRRNRHSTNPSSGFPISHRGSSPITFFEFNLNDDDLRLGRDSTIPTNFSGLINRQTKVILRIRRNRNNSSRKRINTYSSLSLLLQTYVRTLRDDLRKETTKRIKRRRSTITTLRLIGDNIRLLNRLLKDRPLFGISMTSVVVFTHSRLHENISAIYGVTITNGCRASRAHYPPRFVALF